MYVSLRILNAHFVQIMETKSFHKAHHMTLAVSAIQYMSWASNTTLCIHMKDRHIQLWYGSVKAARADHARLTKLLAETVPAPRWDMPVSDGMTALLDEEPDVAPTAVGYMKPKALVVYKKPCSELK